MALTFGNVTISIKSGALIPLLVMLPNIVWMLAPKPDAGKPAPEPLALTIVENVGRFATLILPFFFALDLNKRFSTPVVIAMGAALFAYYACWIRYFTGGKSQELLGAPFLGIPQPMAVMPIAFFTLSSYLMGSWWMFSASVLFGVAHIWISFLIWSR
ncbi:MAG: hypothetical protein JXA21_19710 [Anaerolineae bacterium]|nr:hypothetical protein [Anaerolineae bacterium]